MWNTSSPEGLVVSIMPVAHGSEGDASVAKILHQGDEMPHGTAETVQSPNHQCVAGLLSGQAAPEPWANILGSGELVREREFLGDALLGEGVKLQAEILVVRADAGVTDRASLSHLLCPNIRVEKRRTKAKLGLMCRLPRA